MRWVALLLRWVRELYWWSTYINIYIFWKVSQRLKAKKKFRKYEPRWGHPLTDKCHLWKLFSINTVENNLILRCICRYLVFICPFRSLKIYVQFVATRISCNKKLINYINIWKIWKNKFYNNITYVVWANMKLFTENLHFIKCKRGIQQQVYMQPNTHIFTFFSSFFSV